MKPIWEESKIARFDKLNSNIKCDVLVVGGGIAGVLTAYYLSKEGKKVVLVERDRICSRKTGKTTAVITALQDFFYFDFDYGLAKRYLNANLEAIEEYKKLAEEYDFDFEMVSSYKYGNDYDLLKKEYDFLRGMNYLCHLNEFVYNFKGPALEFKNQAQMNPLKLVEQLISNFEVYENTLIVKIKDNRAYTNDNHFISASDIVVTTGYPFLRIKGLFPLKLHQEKSYVMAIKNDNEVGFNAIGSNKEDLYFRTYGEYLLIGANQAKTGTEAAGFKVIEEYIKKTFNVRIEYRWINQDTVSLDNIPYIGRYTKNSDNLFVASGFNLWGMTAAMISSRLICDLVMGRKNHYESLFSPQRKMLFKPMLSNVKEALKGLVNFKTKRCNHLGCRLIYIDKEECYECPCHGTKYDKKGQIIDGPGNKSKRI